MGYGLLLGLGQGLQNLGNTLEEHNKQKIAAALEDHKMQMQLENEKALATLNHQFDLENHTTEHVVEKTPGVIVKEHVDPTGKVVKEEPADAGDVKDYNYQRSLQDITLKKDQSGLDLNAARIEDIKAMRPYKQTELTGVAQGAVDRGWAAKYKATHPSAGRNALKPPPTPEQLTQLLSTNNEAKSYMSQAKANGMTQVQIDNTLRQAAEGALDAASKGIKDPTQSNPLERFKWLITHNGQVKPGQVAPPVLPSAPSGSTDITDDDNDSESDDDNDTY